MKANPELQKLKKGAIDAAVVTFGANEPFGWTIQQLLDVEVRLASIFADLCYTQLDVKYVSYLGAAGTERGYKFSAEDLATKISWWNFFSWLGSVKGNAE